MFKKVKGDILGRSELFDANLSWIRLRIDRVTGEGEAAPHGTYTSFHVDPSLDQSEQEAVAVQNGYDFLKRGLEQYEQAAREAGYTLK